jgi:hypothetical protein
VTIDGAICVVFDLENPLASDNAMARGRINEAPGIVDAESAKLIIHRGFPGRGLQSIDMRGRFSCKGSLLGVIPDDAIKQTHRFDRAAGGKSWSRIRSR